MTEQQTKLPDLKVGVGALFVSIETNRVLLSIRSPHKTHSMCWSVFGGMKEYNESSKIALSRELTEEMGFEPKIEGTYPFNIYYSKDGHFKYVTFVCVVKEEFCPKLNSENCGYCWINLGEWPKPLHQGVKFSFCNQKSIERLKLILAQYKN